MSNEQLDVEAARMKWYCKECSDMAFDNLSLYTSMMANILEVKQTLFGCVAPVHDRIGWNQSLCDDPSMLQIQKWLFAWMFV